MARTTNAYDTLIYSRYPTAEAQARQDYDDACMAEDDEQLRYDEGLTTLLAMYESHQTSATIRFQRVVVELDRKALRRARSARELAEARLQRIQKALSAGEDLRG